MSASARQPSAPGTVYGLGLAPQLLRQLRDASGQEPRTALPGRPVAGDLVVLSTFAEGVASTLPGGNAFPACRTWKDDRGVRVILVIHAGDVHARDLARAALADECLEVDAAGVPLDPAAWHALRGEGRTRPSLDSLLERFGRELGKDAGRSESALRRLLAAERHEWALASLTDPETGLFGAAFASFKLDEEFKRAQRFHQPLSLVLLDVGLAESALPAPGPARATFLAEVASVFLNECRDIDVLARFSPTTFLFLLPGTPQDGARVLAERMRAELAVREFTAKVRIRPRYGVATVPDPAIPDRNALLDHAEADLGRPVG
ncbi:MAG: GGDEF domain-containing protein [Planctomycetes bacterium]|nr:GGDEF domain-containing protein [Planctomycetota bacterium]